MIVAVSTVKDTVSNVEKFVRRNLGGGVDHLIVFLDAEQPDLEELLAASPWVTCVPTHRDWWHGERQVELNDRQRTHATLAARMLSRFSWVEWMVHIDGDEVVHLDQELLATLGAEVRAFRLTPLEAVARLHAHRDPVLFKPLLDEEQLRRLTRAGVIRRPHNRAFFRGHVRGKVGVRPDPDIRVAIHSATSSAGDPIPEFADPALSVLHYESPTPEECLRKCRALLASGDSVDQSAGRRNVADGIDRLLASTVSPREFEATLEAIFAQHIADDVETLDRLGVLTELDPDSWTHAPEPVPVDDRPTWVAAVAEMRRTPKASVLPPSRRHAPVEGRDSGRM